jgi:hypothetical protein
MVELKTMKSINGNAQPIEGIVWKMGLDMAIRLKQYHIFCLSGQYRDRGIRPESTRVISVPGRGTNSVVGYILCGYL